MSSEEKKSQFGFTWAKVWLPFAFLISIWFVKWLEIRFDLDFSKFGVYPKELGGLKGIVAAPLVHGDVKHLIGNSLPFIALSLAIAYFYDKVSNRVFILAYLCTGLLVWLFGRQSFHIGASGVVYAMASFVFFSGLIRRHLQLIAISLLVVFLYGGMVWGLFPIEPRISWESHLSGAVVGFLMALIFRKLGPQRKKYEWELEEELAEELEQDAQYWAGETEVRYHYKNRIDDKKD